MQNGGGGASPQAALPGNNKSNDLKGLRSLGTSSIHTSSRIPSTAIFANACAMAFNPLGLNLKSQKSKVRARARISLAKIPVHDSSSMSFVNKWINLWESDSTSKRRKPASPATSRQSRTAKASTTSTSTTLGSAFTQACLEIFLRVRSREGSYIGNRSFGLGKLQGFPFGGDVLNVHLELLSTNL